EAIQPQGQPAYFSQLPIKAMVAAMKEAGIPAVVSNTAGTFVCNHIMYQVQYMIDTKYPTLKGGFIHVPFVPEQVVDKPGQPAMSLQDIA
ncbi:pyroglutamyl-peptidase I, partial [Enterococcus faecium]